MAVAEFLSSRQTFPKTYSQLAISTVDNRRPFASSDSAIVLAVPVLPNEHITSARKAIAAAVCFAEFVKRSSSRSAFAKSPEPLSLAPDSSELIALSQLVRMAMLPNDLDSFHRYGLDTGDLGR